MQINNPVLNVSLNARLIIGCLGLLSLLFVALAGSGLSSLPFLLSQHQASLQSGTSPNIDQAVSKSRTRISDFATAAPKSFAAVLHQAFGNKLDTYNSNKLTQQAARGQLPTPRSIVFVPANLLKGAAGAYASEDGGLIFLNEDIRDDTAVLSEVIIHEWAHHLDAILGSDDAQGEEGDIFLRGIRHAGPITSEKLLRLRYSQRGHSTIHFSNKEITIEQGFFDFVAAPFVFVGKAVTDPIGTASSVGKGFANTVVNVGQGIHNAGKGVVNMSSSLVTGNFKGVLGSALNIATAPGNLINKTAVELNEVTPGLGTAANVGVGFTPAALFVASAQGISDTRSGFQNGGLQGGFTALSFAAVDVGMSGVGRANKGLRGAGYTKAVKAKPTTFLGKVKAAPGKGLSSLKKKTPIIKNLDKYRLTRATKKEIKLGKKLMAPGKEKTLKALTKLDEAPVKLGINLGIKGNIPGRDRDDDGNLLGTGGSTNQQIIDDIGSADPWDFNFGFDDNDPTGSGLSWNNDFGYDPDEPVAYEDPWDNDPTGVGMSWDNNFGLDPDDLEPIVFEDPWDNNPSYAPIVIAPPIPDGSCNIGHGGLNAISMCCDLKGQRALDACLNNHLPEDIDNDPLLCDDDFDDTYNDCLYAAQSSKAGSSTYTERAPAPMQGHSSGVGISGRSTQPAR